MRGPDKIIRQTVIVVAIVSTAFLLWRTRELLMIVFGGLIVATILVAMSDGIMRWLPLSRKVATVVSVLVILLVLGVTFWWIGDHFVRQVDQIWKKLPEAVNASVSWLRQTNLGSRLLDHWQGLLNIEALLQRLPGYTRALLGGLGVIILILVLGVYLAAAPQVYFDGVLRLTPPVYRPRVVGALAAAGNGLQQWLSGQLISMLIVGVLTGIGLKLLGVPMALSLGIIAGLTEFVPYLGPIFFGILAILMGFVEGPSTALYVTLLVIAIQQIESNLIMPIVQRSIVSLPPALALVSFVVFGVLFGLFGILFAIPLMVVVMILVDQLYVKALEDETAQEPEGG